MAKDNNNRPEHEDFDRKTPFRDGDRKVILDDTRIVDTLRPPPRIPDNQDNSDEPKR